ncbi:hypothetical protein KM043_000684 [Ampulex compressa]|nr:hypothetical protein KM043_000684 [Ampulex compressa]
MLLAVHDKRSRPNGGHIFKISLIVLFSGPEFVFHVKISRTSNRVKDGYIGNFPHRPKIADELSRRLDNEYNMFALKLKLLIIIELLNVGADLSDRIEIFETKENLDLDRCNATFDDEDVYSPGVNRQGGKPRYMVEAVVYYSQNYTMKIVKTTHLSNCKPYGDYYYGSYGDILMNDRVGIRLLSSIQRIAASKSEFTTRLIGKGLIEDINKDEMEYLENITLTVSDIREAKEELPIGPNASMTNITVNGEFEKSPSAAAVQG